MNILSTDDHMSGPAVSLLLNNQLHWCLLNFIVKSYFKLFFHGKNVLQHKITARIVS